jgi:hypothetical protein
MENVFLGCIEWYVINECQSPRIEQRLSDKRGVEQAGQARPMQESPLDDDELRCRKLRNLPVPQFLAGWLAAPASFVLRCQLRRCRSSATRQRTRQNEKSRYEKNLLSRDDRRRIKAELKRTVLVFRAVRGTTPLSSWGLEAGSMSGDGPRPARAGAKCREGSCYVVFRRGIQTEFQ